MLHVLPLQNRNTTAYFIARTMGESNLPMTRSPAEARPPGGADIKDNVCATRATQVITQLPRESIDAVFGNCATVIGFRVGGEDTQTPTPEFVTVLPASNLQDLPDYKTFIRTMSAEPGRPGQPQGPMTVKTFPAFARQAPRTTRPATSKPAFDADPPARRG